MAYSIPGITNAPNQTLNISMPDGTILVMGLQYWDQNMGWYFTTLSWNNASWVENGRRVVSHLNMLRNYRNQINFGISCITQGNREPTNINDFASGASVLSILIPAEVSEVEAFLESVKLAQV